MPPNLEWDRSQFPQGSVRYTAEDPGDLHDSIEVTAGVGPATPVGILDPIRDDNGLKITFDIDILSFDANNNELNPDFVEQE